MNVQVKIAQNCSHAAMAAYARVYGVMPDLSKPGDCALAERLAKAGA